MKRTLTAVFVTVIVAASTVILTACGTPKITAVAAVPGTEIINLLAGETAALELSFTFDKADISAEQQAEVIEELGITYTSDNEAVCVVDESGTVTAGNGGEAIVTAAIGENLTATWSVSVTVPVERVSIATGALELFINGEDSGSVGATVQPSNATESAILYTSSDTAIVTVDSTTGQVKAVSNGTATVTATAGEKSATVSVTVSTLPTEITLESIEGWLYGGGSVTLNPVLLPEESVQDFTVESDNPEIATATQNEDGSITISAIGTGTAAITVQAGDVSATYTLTVRARPAQTPAAPSGGSGGQGNSGGGTNSGSAPSQGDDLSLPYGGPYGWGHIPGVRPSAQNPSIGIGPDGTRYSAQGDVMNVVPPGTERPPMPTEPPIGMAPDSGYWEWDEIGYCWNYWLNPGDGTNGGQAGGM